MSTAVNLFISHLDERTLVFFILLLRHGCENLLHLINDAVQLVWVPLHNFLDGVAHCRLTKECSVSQLIHYQCNQD